jgi:hypothetical protein
MVEDLESVAPGLARLLGLEPGVGELDDAAAFQADHVIVVPVADRVLVKDAVVTERAFFDEPRVHEDTQRAVRGDPADAGPTSPGEGTDFVGGQVVMSGEDGLGERQPLPGGREAPLAQCPAERIHLGSHC